MRKNKIPIDCLIRAWFFATHTTIRILRCQNSSWPRGGNVFVRWLAGIVRLSVFSWPKFFLCCCCCCAAGVSSRVSRLIRATTLKTLCNLNHNRPILCCAVSLVSSISTTASWRLTARTNACSQIRNVLESIRIVKSKLWWSLWWAVEQWQQRMEY